MKAIAIILTVFLIGAGTPTTLEYQNDLMGSWTLVKYRYGQDTELNQVPEFLNYVKNVTESHYSWCSYNPEDGSVAGAGGGTYEFTGGKYIEKTDFWFPSGTDIPGTETAFDTELKGNMWTIRGYIKSVELDPGSGEFVEIDSTFMEEVWMRVSK